MSENPREKEPKAPFPDQPQEPPGLEAEMTPAPDFGEATYRGASKLSGKAAVITGGDSGIGRAIALAFAREGANVLISYLSEEETDAQETRRVVEAAGQKCVLLPGDITSETHCREIIKRAVNDFGKLDILVNNAAFQMSHKGIEGIPSEVIERTFRTNVLAMFYLSQAALPVMSEGGVTINATSLEGHASTLELAAYA